MATMFRPNKLTILRGMGREMEMGLPGMMRNTARWIAAVVVDSITARVSAVMVGAGWIAAAAAAAVPINGRMRADVKWVRIST